jgi:hypothetical protein
VDHRPGAAVPRRPTAKIRSPNRIVSSRWAG